MEKDIVGRLIEKIHEVFDETYYPADERVAPNFDLRFESEQFLEKLGEKDWREVTGKSIRPHGDGLPLLSPEIFRYYLPAFLLNTLQSSSTQDFYDILEDSTLFALTRLDLDNNADEMDEFWLERFAPLTRGQKLVIFEFLSYYNEKNPGELFVGVGVDPIERNRRIQRILKFWERFAEESIDRVI